MFDALEKSFKKNGLNTTREGDNITIQGLAKETKKPTPKPRAPAEQAARTADKNDPTPDDKAMEEMRKQLAAKKLQDQLNKGYEGATGGKKAGGAVKMAKGGAVKSSASRRADGAAQRGKTKGRTL
jgi:hypothetical protein